MNITKENIDDLNAILRVKIDKDDYQNKIEETLKDYRKKANIKGFRPGMVPIGLIRKMYGKAVKLDEINKLVSESIQKFLSDEKIEILGDPLPIAEEQESIDFEIREDFTFSFELGLSPAIDLNLTKKNKLPSYEIIIDEKMKNDYADNYRRRFGEFKSSENSEEKDILKGDIVQLDESGNISENGISVEGTTLAIDIIKDDDIKKSFVGRNAGDTIDFDLKKAFPNDNEVAGLLKTSKEEAEKAEGTFRFTISEVSRFVPAELNQEFFDRIYGADEVKSEEEFINRITGEITESLANESEYKLMIDLRKLAIDKCDAALPEEFLKKWLLKVNENNTPEQIEKEFDSFRRDLKWQLIKNRVAKDNSIKITHEDMQKEAENITRQQFRQYGLFYATDEQISNYAAETLKREEDARRIAEKLVEDKVLNILKDIVKLEPKKVTSEEFNKLFE